MLVSSPATGDVVAWLDTLHDPFDPFLISPLPDPSKVVVPPPEPADALLRVSPCAVMPQRVAPHIVSPDIPPLRIQPEQPIDRTCRPGGQQHNPSGKKYRPSSPHPTHINVPPCSTAIQAACTGCLPRAQRRGQHAPMPRTTVLSATSRRRCRLPRGATQSQALRAFRPSGISPSTESNESDRSTGLAHHRV